MFGLQNAEKYKKKDERRLKTATVMVAVITAGLYIAFIISMLITKSGVLALFAHAKPVVNSYEIQYKGPDIYKNLNYDFFVDRFNWLFDENYARLYFAYDNDFGENDLISKSDLNALNWLEITDDQLAFTNSLEQKYILEDMEDDQKKEIRIKVKNYADKLYNFIQTNDIDNYKFLACMDAMLILPEGNGKKYSLININNDIETVKTYEVPNGKTFFGVFGGFLLISAILKILTITKSYHHGKFEFKYGALGVKICSIIEVIGLIVVTYVFFWLLMWDVPIFYSLTEPSMLYYLRFALPVILLNVLYTFLYNKAADTEED